MNIKKVNYLILLGFLLITCTSSNVESSGNNDIFRNQTGTLTWGGSPVVDGVGMLFVVDDKEYIWCTGHT